MRLFIDNIHDRVYNYEKTVSDGAVNLPNLNDWDFNDVAAFSFAEGMVAYNKETKQLISTGTLYQKMLEQELPSFEDGFIWYIVAPPDIYQDLQERIFWIYIISQRSTPMKILKTKSKLSFLKIMQNRARWK